MTPEELNQTMEFIIASQARLAAAQEQDRQDRIEFEKSSRAFEKSARAMDARLVDLQRQQAELLVHQSERLDNFQQLHSEWIQQFKRFEDLQRQGLHLFHMILDRLPPATGPV